MLAPIGWFVVHALWIGIAIGGITTLVLALLDDHRARLRHNLAYAGLLLMVVAPLLATAGSMDLFTPAARIQVTEVVERTIGLPALVEWRGRVVRGAAVAWLAGVAFCLIRVGREWRRTACLRATGLADAGPQLRDLVTRLAIELHVRPPVTIVRSDRAEVPMVCGWRRPVILLPRGVTSQLESGQLRAVLAHELAHVRRLDYPANLLQVAAEAVLWFHPAARWVSRRVRIEREYCCDDVAVTAGGDAAEYVRALAALEDARSDYRLVVAAASGTLLDRLQRIVGHPRPTLRPVHGTCAAVGAAIVAAAIVTLAMVVPPAMPLDARLRSRTPAPGAMPGGPTFPRVPRR